MTRETKIGLIVGLAFIVMFAVILSHKGADRSPPAGEGQWSRAAPRLAESDEPATPEGTAAADREPTARARASRRPSRHASADGPRPRAPAPVAGAPSHPGAGPGQGREPNLAPPLPDEVRSVPITPRGATKPPRATKPPLRQNRPPKSRPGQPFPILPTNKPATEYVVRERDNLTKIAKRVYGNDSPKLVRRIFEANRHQLANMHTIRVGQKLRLPDWPNANAFVAVRNFPPAAVHARQGVRTDLKDAPRASYRGPTLIAPRGSSNAAASKAGTPRSDTHYVVKEHETYSMIARDQLGDGRRWKDIAALNKDIFPDPDRIRPGVRIRLPADPLASLEVSKR